MNATEFENNRWKSGNQKVVFRHRAALEFVEKGSVLDLGCGDGMLLTMLREMGIESEGLDISPEAVRKCITKGLKARVHPFDQVLPYADNTFDTVMLLDVLEHLYDPASLLREAARVSRAVVIVGVPNFSSLPARLQVFLGMVPENNHPHKGHIYWFNHKVLYQMAENAGLSVVGLRMNTFFPLSLFGECVPRVLPNLLALSFVVRLQKHA